MEIQSVQNTVNVTSTGYRSTVYTTIKDPATNKQITEVVVYLYNRTSQVEPLNTKGHQVDIQA